MIHPFTHFSHRTFPALQYESPTNPILQLQPYPFTTTTDVTHLSSGSTNPVTNPGYMYDKGGYELCHEMASNNDSESYYTNSPFIGTGDVIRWEETLDPRHLVQPSNPIHMNANYTLQCQTTESPSSSSDHASIVPSITHAHNSSKREMTESPLKFKSQTMVHRKTASCSSADEPVLVAPPRTINGKSSHSRKVPVGHVRRAPNAFMLFRSDYAAKVEGLHQRDVSRFAGALWREVGVEARNAWKQYADMVREIHEAGRKPSKRVIIPKSKLSSKQKISSASDGEAILDHKIRVNQEADELARQHIVLLRLGGNFDQILPPGFRSSGV